MSTSMQRKAAAEKAKAKKVEYDRTYKSFRRTVDQSFVDRESIARKKYNDFTRFARLYAKLHSKEFSAFMASEQRPMYAEISRPIVKTTQPTLQPTNVSVPNTIDPNTFWTFQDRPRRPII